VIGLHSEELGGDELTVLGVPLRQGELRRILTPAAKQKSVKTAASVVWAAVSDMHPDSAVVLVFINQNTISKENPDGSFAASAVKVGLKKINDTWLISSFDPV
jgi:Mce-associated membrane protein